MVNGSLNNKFKSSLLKNVRNYAEYLRKKERGPVKAFFHITKNENVPAIEQQGLLTNHPNANVNSAAHPFRKHGTDAGGVWVTTEPTAFPVYGTTIGGKNGNASARADALSTIKIEVPLPELAKMKAVQDPYGKNILRKGNDPRAVQKSDTWAGIDVPTTVLLNDVKPQWLINIGYVEEAATSSPAPTLPTLVNLPSGWGLPKHSDLRWLDKGRFKEYTGFTGHRHGSSGYDKSPQRLVNEYIDKNQPITKRLPTFPMTVEPASIARFQGAKLKYNSDDIFSGFVEQDPSDSWVTHYIDGSVAIPGANALKRYSTDFIPSDVWSTDYSAYVKPGESVANKRYFGFAPGAISRGIGGEQLPTLKERNFNWNTYKKLIEKGKTPALATDMAKPEFVLDWDNIVFRGAQCGPSVKRLDKVYAPAGAISRGIPYDEKSLVQTARANRTAASAGIKKAKADATKFLTSKLGRQPTAEEIDNWARHSIVNDIVYGDIEDAPSILNTWAYKADWDIIDRLKREFGGK